MSKPIRETVKERLKRDPEFKKALEEEMKIGVYAGMMKSYEEREAERNRNKSQENT